MKNDLQQWALMLIGASENEFNTLIASLNPDQRSAIGDLHKWSPKDEIAHLSYWLEVFLGNIQRCQNGQELIDTRDYLTLNDQAWEVRKDWTWNDVERVLERTLKGIEVQIKNLSSQDLTDPQRLSLEPDQKVPRPLLKSLIYELIDHPLHHFLGMHRKLQNEHLVAPMLERLLEVMEQPGVSKWSITTRNKLRKQKISRAA
jgi:Protein of unknown function (DUF1706)